MENQTSKKYEIYSEFISSDDFNQITRADEKYHWLKNSEKNLNFVKKLGLKIKCSDKEIRILKSSFIK